MGNQPARQPISENEKLLLSVVEQIKLPLTQMARLAELEQGDGARAAWETVRVTAGSALGLVESYALSLRLHGRLAAPEMMPLTVSALLYDTAHELNRIARLYNVEIELEAASGLQPVMADQQVLQAALTSLGYVFVMAAGAATAEHRLVRLAAHRNRYGVVAGLYAPLQDFGTDSLRRAHQVQATARQPLPRLSAGSAAGVFVADNLLRSLSTRLHVARYHKLTGLAATLVPSQQLQLV